MIPCWLSALARHAGNLVPAILVTVTEVRGSAPRACGTKMVFTAHGQDDTIGGGALEYECGRVAREMLRSGAAQPVMRNFPLGPALGQCCGGHVSVMLEPILPPDWSVVVFGAGHVGHAVIRLLATLPCRVTWVDDRAELFGSPIPENVVCVSEPVESLAIPSNAMVLVMSHDHQLDYRIVRWCLEREGLRFIGLIGSQTKRARFLSRLARQGFPDSTLRRITSPIGLMDVGSKLPAEIAISIVAQLLSLRDAKPDVVASTAEAPTSSATRNLTVAGCDGCAARV